MHRTTNRRAAKGRALSRRWLRHWLVGAAVAAPAAAQVAIVPDFRPRVGVAMARHALTGSLVRFGGAPSRALLEASPPGAMAETWVLFPGGGWTDLAPAQSPPPRVGHSLTAFGGGDVLLFGGRDDHGAFCNDLWGFDGVTWSLRSQSPTPSGRWRHGAEFDPVRQRLVVFGGIGANGDLGDHWEYTGAAWVQRTPAVVPPPGRSDAMAFNPVTQRLAMMQQGPEVYEWDGTDWTAITPPFTAFFALSGHRLVTDSVFGVLLVGGDDLQQSTLLARLARWDGSTWTDITNAPEAALRRDHAVAADPSVGEVYTFGGDRFDEVGQPAYASTWQRTFAGAWSQIDQQAPAASFGFGAVALADGSLLQMGGYEGQITSSATWRHDGQGWTRLADLPGSGGGYTSAAFDSARGRVVAFGGSSFILPPSPPIAFGQTYEWDGASWSIVATSGPSARIGAGMAFDPLRGRTVLFGGTEANGSVTNERFDTWEWDGATWTQRFPATTPPVRGPMTFVRPLGVVAMNAQGTLWTYDGADWAPWAAAPAAGAIAVDEGRDRLVLSAATGLFEFDGGTWTLLSATAPAGVPVWSAPRRRVLLAAGTGRVDVFATRPGTWRPVGVGCNGTVGAVTLSPENDPYVAGDWRVRFAKASPLPLPAGPRFVYLGFPSTTSGGLRLPIDHTGLGLTGCLQYIDPAFVDVTLLVRWTLTVPDAPALDGIDFTVQALLPDPTANPLGVILTDSLLARVGGR